MKLKASSAACTGTRHLQEGTPCQDFVATEKWDSCTGAALSDGAGSCQYSHYGASTIVQTVLRLMEERREEWANADKTILAADIIDSCLAALSKNEYELTEQAATLLFCLVSSDGKFICGHLGDGCIFKCSKEQASIISLPFNGERLNETVFVTTPCAPSFLRWQEGQLFPGEAIILCSDGSSEVLYGRSTGECAPALCHITEWMESSSEAEVDESLYENMDELFRSNTWDDMSIAIVSLHNDDI